ncbi:MAG: hypothetical protein Q9209_000032 [Squamulea sp. 1 TL-2023]
MGPIVFPSSNDSLEPCPTPSPWSLLRKRNVIRRSELTFATVKGGRVTIGISLSETRVGTADTESLFSQREGCARIWRINSVGRAGREGEGRERQKRVARFEACVVFGRGAVVGASVGIQPSPRTSNRVWMLTGRLATSKPVYNRR